MASSRCDNFLTILLVGKAGEGKSSTGNSILGENKFKTSSTWASVTQTCQTEVARVQRHNVMVVDSPGLADADISTADGLKYLGAEVVHILASNPDGFDAILIVTKYGRRSADDTKVFKELASFFGAKYIEDHGILVVTHADNHEPKECDGKSIEEFMQSQGGIFLEMLKKCNNRMVIFENRPRSDSIAQAQVRRLLNIVATLNRTSSSSTPKIFREAQAARDRAVKDADRPFINKSTKLRLKLAVAELGKIPALSRDTQSLEAMVAELARASDELKKQDKGTGKLKAVMFTVSSLEGAVRKRIEATLAGRDMTQSMEFMNTQISALEKLMVEDTDSFGKTMFTAIGSSAVAIIATGLGVINPVIAIGAVALSSFFTYMST